MRKIAFVLTALLSWALISGASEEFTGIVNAKSLRLRSAPSTDSNIIGLVNSGNQLRIVAVKNGWAEVRLPSYVKVYVKSDDVQAGKTVRETTLYADTKGKNAFGMKLPLGSVVTTTPAKDGMLAIVPPDTLRIYVSMEYIKPLGSTADKTTDGGSPTAVSGTDKVKDAEDLKAFVAHFNPDARETREVTISGYLYDTGKNKNPRYALYRFENSKPTLVAFLKSPNSLPIAKFNEKNVRIVGDQYTIPKWETKIIWIKSLRETN